MNADYYTVMGVSPQATAEEIKKAYRRRARELHPDARPGDPAAEEEFKELARAYEVLSDPTKRARYDRFGEAGLGGGGGDPFGFGGAGGLGDIFDAFFGGGGGFGGGRPAGPPPGSDVEVEVEITLVDSVFGARHPVTVRTAVPCDTCEATGAEPGTHPEPCAECGGSGQVRRVRQSILGQMVTAAPCGRCGGLGQVVASPCGDCGGQGRTVEDRTYTVDIPPGVDTGSTLRIGGLGAVGPRGGAHGDLYVHVRVQPHETLRREGIDLVHDLHIPITQAVLGVRLPYETLDGEEELVLPRGTQTGQQIRFRGRGVPHVRGRGRGDLVVRVHVDVPTDLDADQEQMWRDLADRRGEDVAPPDEGLLSRLRSAFR